MATWELIKTLDLPTLHWNKEDDSVVRLEDGSWLTMAEARGTHPDFDLTRSWNLPDVEPLHNENWRSYLRRIGFDRQQLQYVRRSFANACGENMRFLSAKAMLAMIRDKDGESGLGDYRIMGGYDKVVEYLAEGLELHLNDPTMRISWSVESGVTVTTLGNKTYNADAAVIAVPLGVLQANMIGFDPLLPELKRTALAGLRMGPVIKLIYKFAEPIIHDEIMAIYSRENPPMWWSPSFGHDTNETIWTAFVSGSWAVDLLALGEAGALEHGLNSLKKELGRDDLEAMQSYLVNWPDDPYTRGGYSFVLPGFYGARERLAEPTLRFTGRARRANPNTAPPPFTAHF